MKSKKHSLLCFFAFLLSLSAACGAPPGTDESVNAPVHHSLTLGWDAPSLNTDGTQLSDLAGYMLYYRLSEGFNTTSINVGYANLYTIENLLPGQYHISVTAYDEYGNESSHSSEIIAYIP